MANATVTPTSLTTPTAVRVRDERADRARKAIEAAFAPLCAKRDTVKVCWRTAYFEVYATPAGYEVDFRVYAEADCGTDTAYLSVTMTPDFEIVEDPEAEFNEAVARDITSAYTPGAWTERAETGFGYCGGW